jgi:hypothetical protein
MTMKAYVASAALVAAALISSGAAEASCKQGFCMSGYYNGNQRWVDFTTTMNNYTHFNVFNGRDQIELGRNERTFRVYKTAGSNPKNYRYRIQACNKGSVFEGSSCSPWVNFSHTDKS